MTDEPAQRRLLTVIRLLAQPASAQIKQLTRLGVTEYADELRLQYEDAIAAAGKFLQSSASPAQVTATQTLSAHFRALTARKTPQLWTERALRRTPEWGQVRDLAAEVLEAFDAWPRRWGKARRRTIRAEANPWNGYRILL